MPINKRPSGLFIGIEKEERFQSSNITDSCHNNISFQDCSTLQDHLRHLRHNEDQQNKYFRSNEAPLPL